MKKSIVHIILLLVGLQMSGCKPKDQSFVADRDGNYALERSGKLELRVKRISDGQVSFKTSFSERGGEHGRWGGALETNKDIKEGEIWFVYCEKSNECWFYSKDDAGAVERWYAGDSILLPAKAPSHGVEAIDINNSRYSGLVPQKFKDLIKKANVEQK